MDNREIECRFLEIDKEALIKKLRELGAEDYGEKLLEETVFYNSDLSWKHLGKRVRIRTVDNKTKLAYKEKTHEGIDGVLEIEFGIEDASKAENFLTKVGLCPSRKQQKLRHTLVLNDVAFDIDTWPKVPTYVELEGLSEEAIRNAASSVGLDWNDVSFDSPGTILHKKYGIRTTELKYFTFDRVE